VDNPVLRAALAGARKGWPVFPCHPGRKVAATLNGYRDATTDPSQVREWFAGHRELNLAVAAGAPGPDVLDLGPLGREPEGFHGLWHLREAGLLDGASAAVNTPGSGVHLYFEGSAQPGDRLPGWHLDLIAQGGYVLVPPSRVAGQPYSGAGIRGRQPGRLDRDAAVKLPAPSRTRERPPEPEPGPEPPDPEAGT
jgi:Bifunctional DNA primase/polymerase, N-terminal